MLLGCKFLVGINAGVVKLADTPALGAGGRNPVGVQVSPPAQERTSCGFRIWSDFR